MYISKDFEGKLPMRYKKLGKQKIIQLITLGVKQVLGEWNREMHEY